MNTKEAQKWAKQFADDLQGPLGPKPLVQVIKLHITVFQTLLSDGASWKQISNLMYKSGVVGRHVNCISPAQWRVMYHRVFTSSEGIGKNENLSIIKKGKSEPLPTGIKNISFSIGGSNIKHPKGQNDVLDRINRVSKLRIDSL